MGGSELLGKFLGVVALVTTIIGLMPQIYHTYRAKVAQGLSMLMLLNYVICAGAWLGYGWLNHDGMMVVANIFCGCTALISIGQKIYYDRYYQPAKGREPKVN